MLDRSVEGDSGDGERERDGEHERERDDERVDDVSSASFMSS